MLFDYGSARWASQGARERFEFDRQLYGGCIEDDEGRSYGDILPERGSAATGNSFIDERLKHRGIMNSHREFTQICLFHQITKRISGCANPPATAEEDRLFSEKGVSMSRGPLQIRGKRHRKSAVVHRVDRTIRGVPIASTGEAVLMFLLQLKGRNFNGFPERFYIGESRYDCH